ncbi:hypothetical protein [Microbulbifer sp. HZ11]|uniref:hypothetical protein n=1 Tax=unclassified Microbulbifer TaxID=2619833 RepID=UPI00068C686C|nr:hypothetical protein [Microbulbifer sp. HZ11]
MISQRSTLIAAGVITLAGALLHIFIIIGGPDWYRFWGAGEEMARMAESGSTYPAIVTLFIASVLLIWSAYAFGAANVIRRLPLTRVALYTIGAILLARGLLGVPLLFVGESAYFAELQVRPAFLFWSSLLCIGLGSLYTLGAIRLNNGATESTSSSSTP